MTWVNWLGSIVVWYLSCTVLCWTSMTWTIDFKELLSVQFCSEAQIPVSDNRPLSGSVPSSFESGKEFSVPQSIVGSSRWMWLILEGLVLFSCWRDVCLPGLIAELAMANSGVVSMTLLVCFFLLAASSTVNGHSLEVEYNPDRPLSRMLLHRQLTAINSAVNISATPQLLGAKVGLYYWVLLWGELFFAASRFSLSGSA